MPSSATEKRPDHTYGTDSKAARLRLLQPISQRGRMAVSLTIHCVTTGRPTLQATLASIVSQRLSHRDQVLLVCDGPETEAVSRAWRESGLSGELLFLNDGPHDDWGHTPRNRTEGL